MAPQSSVADKFNWFTSVIIWSVAFDLCAGRAQRPASSTKLQCDALINAFTGGRNESLKRWSPRCKQPHNQPWLTNWPCCRVHAQHHQHRQPADLSTASVARAASTLANLPHSDNCSPRYICISMSSLPLAHYIYIHLCGYAPSALRSSIENI